MTTSPEANMPTGTPKSSTTEKPISQEREDFLRQLDVNAFDVLIEKINAGLTDEQIVAEGVILAAYQRTVEQKRDVAA